MEMLRPITSLKGIGEKTKALYQKLGIYTLGDLLLYYPRTYQSYPPLGNYRSLSEGQIVAIMARLKSPAKVKKTTRMDLALATAFFGDQTLELIWYRAPYIRSQLQVGIPYVFYGKLESARGRLQISQADIFTPEKYQSLMTQLQPIYSLTKGLSLNQMRKNMQQLLEGGLDIGDYLPEDLLSYHLLPKEDWALRQIHFPLDMDSLMQARRRLVYDEFFLFLLRMQQNQRKQKPEPNQHPMMREAIFLRVKNNLPYQLTRGQEEALADIREDLSAKEVRQRLIQGDVGSGKTIVAFLAMLLCLENGYQAAIMAPTEVLARQHEGEFLRLVREFDLPYSVVCLTGSNGIKERRELEEMIKREKSLFIIGTQALIQDKVEFQDLALVVTDEQHRFGVKQRKSLADKGQHPHVLVMSATPIPRTLAMILYGDMNLSVIRDMPAMRKKIKNALIKSEQKETAWKFIAKEVLAGRQAYVICPLIEASELSEDENVIDYAQTLARYYGDQIQVGLLHGRMSSKEKNQIMEDFASGHIQVLVSTTVVEVGVNVPNASVMVIEDANRFGLAQLHQLRGRVGRGIHQSYCIFIDASEKEDASKRLEVLVHSTDGFAIASEDLKMRGPGDFFGIRQSGDLNFALADIYQDADLLQLASEDIKEILDYDPDLRMEEHAAIRKHLANSAGEVYTIL